MKIYSYIVTHDTGFSPNPFHEFCTLACCKPDIRRKAKEGDWVVGLTPKADGHRILYFMEVEESLTFGEYWFDARFKLKIPRLDGTAVARNGDNIYQPSESSDREFRQLPSWHSTPRFSGTEDEEKKGRDLGGERVLVSTKFAYFGSKALTLPQDLEFLRAGFLRSGRGHRCRFSDRHKEAFRIFAGGQKFGLNAPPRQWSEGDASWKCAGCGKP